MRTKHILVILLFLGGILSTQAATYRAIANGNWSDNIWNQSGYPGINDDVIIDGYFVTVPINTIAHAKSLTLTNSDGLDNRTRLDINSAQLIIEEQASILSDQNTNPSFSNNIVLAVNNGTFMVNGDFVVTKATVDSNRGSINIQTSGNAKIYVFNNMTLEYNPVIGDSSIVHKLAISESSELIVKGDFIGNIYDKNNLDFSFSETAILMAEQDLILNSYEDASINFSYNSSDISSTIGNNFQLNSTGTIGGLNSEINLNAGILNVKGNLKLSSDDPTQLVKLHLDGIDNVLKVDGGIELDARSQSTVSIILGQTSILEVAKTIERVTDYGNLFMNPNSLLVFNFNNLTTIPVNNLSGSNTDQFQYSNIKLVNTSGSPLELDGPLILDYSLELDSGIIKTDSINIIILRENATITGGNQDAYIDGPIEKRGMSTSNFVMPLGNKGIYAPLEISATNDPNTIFRGQFFGDPPPIGGVPPDIDRVNEDQYWVIDRMAGAPVDVVMNWEDGQVAGVSNMDIDSITTLYLDPVTNEWTNAGRGTVTGSTASGQAGSISTDLLGDPPPIGAVAVIIGTVSTNSVLPVELLTFKAEKEKNKMLLSWVTSAEINVSHFELERSINGIEFTKIGRKTAIGGATKTTHYTFEDASPELGTNYYRLRNVDLDGSEDVSQVVSIRFQNVDTPVAFPNPVREQLLIVGLNPASYQVIVEVFNSSGQLLFQQNRSVNDGKIELQMEEVNVSFKGTYYIRIIDDARTHNITILKK